MQSKNYVDISFTVLDRVRQGRRLLRDLNTGQIFWEEPEPELEPVPPLVDLLGIREKELDEAFKPLGAKVDAEIIAPVKLARKPRKKNGA